MRWWLPGSRWRRGSDGGIFVLVPRTVGAHLVGALFVGRKRMSRHPEVRASGAPRRVRPRRSGRLLRGSRCARAPQDDGYDSSFSRCNRIRVLPKPFPKAPQKARGAERRKAHNQSRTGGCGAPSVFSPPGRKYGGGSPLGAPLRCSGPSDLTPRLSVRAALHADGRVRTLPAPSWALKRCTSRTGHTAGRVDARIARERGYKLRPREPHSPHQSNVSG
jgi:hypothetical protein